MLKKFFGHLINKVYQHFCQDLSALPLQRFSYASSYIEFDGWELSYNWKGRVSLSHDIVGDTWILYKSISFNYRYFLCLLNTNGGEEFSFAHFVQTFAHEIAHCLLLDYKISFEIEQHGEEHLKLTEIIRQYCEKMPEFQLLYKCQKESLFAKNSSISLLLSTMSFFSSFF